MPTIATTIRPARREDCTAVTAMVHDLARDGGVVSGTRSETLEREAFGPRPTLSILVAEAEGEPVGCLIHQPTFSTWRGENGVFVADFYVLPAHRGRGIGQALIAAAAREGWDGGARFLRLDVEHRNADAQRLYARLGFHVVDHVFMAMDEPQMARLVAAKD